MSVPRHTTSLKTVGIKLPGARLLEVENLTVTFPTSRGDVDVVKDATFSLEAGETLGIVGESGSGKSMTSLAIMGLLPTGGRTTGSIKLNGHELTARSDVQLRRVRGERIGMIFQDPLSSLNPYYTVGLQIEEAYRAHRGGSRKAARKVAIDALDRVQIADAEHRIDYYPHQFSGGMRQRIMIAMAVCLEPDLLIADEPTTALDVTVQAQILELLEDLQADTGMGMVFITHDLAVVSEIADRVLVMRDGLQVEQGTAEDVFARTTQPYTRTLLDAVPRIDDTVGTMKEIGE
ncbi:ABC transporter ATP-binding protein [Microbacterium invictum]|uniref:Peptide/nickel transport system ATP-binding protein n=1 Tax=Microbacterium invictum TaxID=515415 RepID=A0AA40SPC8_9MICO|nr:MULTISPECIES: ABC transporter ATP-binding protein [Microbacterium]MBB4139963.1 peptide/nickel transport system ATP-binding protein [Microbacterium invictum]